MPRPRRSALLLALLCLASFAAFLISVLANQTPSKPNLILISIDTLRASELGLYGGRAYTPRMNEFGQDNVWFADFIANGSWTRPTFASLFTGLYPSTHQANRERDPQTSRQIWSKPLARSFTTMAEIFKRNGYHTAAISTNPQCGPVNGFDQGFEEFQTTVDEDIRQRYPKWLSAAAMHTQFARWLDKNRASRQPVFVWFHFTDPHAPYDPPVAAGRKWVGSSYDEAVNKKLGWIAGWPAPKRRRVTPAEVEAIRGLYTAEVENVDRYVGQLLDDLKRAGWYDKSIVVIVADHGEELFEHEQDPPERRKLYTRTVGHGIAHYEQLVHIPLMIHYPGVTPRKVTGVAADVDLLPTVMELAGLRSPAAARFEGQSLVGAMKGQESLRERVAFISTVPDNAELLSVRTRQYKLIYHVEEDVAELYDLEADPGETRDLAEKEPETAAQLLRLLKKHMEGRTIPGPLQP